MSRPFLLSALVARCKRRCDMENDSHISDTEWKEIISTAYGELHSILAASGMRYFESTQSVASSALADDGAGGGSIALPAAFLSTVGVDRQEASDRWVPLHALMAQERNDFTSAGAGRALAWATIGANLHLFPKPPTGQTYRHIYIPQPTDLSASADSTSVDVVTGDGEAFLIEYVAVRALSKEESDVTVAMAERERARARVEKWAALKALNTPRHRVAGDGGDPVDPASWRYR